jgi:UrcA family protein
METAMKLKITLAMLMCGLGAATAAGIAGAAPADLDVRSLAVKYDPTALETDGGARQLYARIAKAAVDVCPSFAPHLVSPEVQACRQQAIESAVAKVHNERLAAVYLSATKRG